MKRKFALFGSVALALIVLTIWAVPVFAADSTDSAQQPAQITLGNRTRVLIRLLLVQDEAKVDAFIAKAEDAGKLTSEQAVKVKDFWTAHHERFAKNVVLVRLLRAQDESKVKALLDKGVANGRIQQAQADKIIQMWEILHAPKPAA